MKKNRFVVIALTLIAASLALSKPLAAPHYSTWSEPVRLDAPVNSAYNELAAALSKDGSALYFTSDRPCDDTDTVLDQNIWVVHWDPALGRWGDDAHCLAINVDGYQDSAPTFSRDGHWMYFTSDRGASPAPPAFNSRDIYLSSRLDVHDDDSWTEPFLADGVNSAFADAGPSYFENEDGALPQLYFASNRQGTFDIHVADIYGGATFGPPRPVDELNTSTLVEARPFIRHDGLEMFFFCGPAGSLVDIYVASRPDPSSRWSQPVNLGAPVNTTFIEQQPALSSDGETLLLVSNRPGSMGTNLDIWMSTRTKLHGR